MEAAIPGLTDVGTTPVGSSAANDPLGTKNFPSLTPQQSAANAKAAGATPSSSSSSNALTGAAGGALGKTEFLQLLVQEMTNQDPLKPADNTQFIAQLAQFSTLEQMQNMNDGFTKLQNSSQANQATALLSLGQANVPINAVNGTTGQSISGPVDKILLNSDGTVQVDVNGTAVNLGDILSIGPAPATSTGSGTGAPASANALTGASAPQALPGALIPPTGSSTPNLASMLNNVGPTTTTSTVASGQ
jgi:flagellar basal-body rod modification protein FlgD